MGDTYLQTLGYESDELEQIQLFLNIRMRSIFDGKNGVE